MKKIIYCAVSVFSVILFTACDRKPTETTEKKKEGPVMEFKEEVQAPKSDTTVFKKNSSGRKQ